MNFFKYFYCTRIDLLLKWIKVQILHVQQVCKWTDCNFVEADTKMISLSKNQQIKFDEQIREWRLIFILAQSSLDTMLLPVHQYLMLCFGFNQLTLLIYRAFFVWFASAILKISMYIVQQ